VRFRRVVPGVVVLAGLAALAAFQSVTAHAAATPGLPVTNVYQVVADTAHDHLFISQGTAGTDDPMLVTDLNGDPITTIGAAVQGLALSADGKTLYAGNGNAVTAISTTTLKQAASYSLPSGARAIDVAVQDGQLWVTYQNTNSVDAGQIGEIDLASGSATWNAVPGNWPTFPPEIALGPSGTGLLVTASVGLEPQTVATYDVSNPAAVSLVDSTTSLACGDSHGLPVLPGGTTFLCDGFPYSTATLAPQNSSGTFYGGSAAVAPDGAIAVGGGGSAENLLVYPSGGTTPSASYYQWSGIPLPSSFILNSSFPVSFAWSADSQRLFTVVESVSNDGSPVFTALSLYPFKKVPADLTLTSTATTVGYDASAVITPHLGVTDTNRSVSVYETIAGEPRQLIWSGAADPGSVTFSPSFKRNTTFTAVFSGDARYLPTTVTRAIKVDVTVAAALRGYYKSAKVSGTAYRVYHHTGTVKDAVTVTPDKRGECVRLLVQKYSRGSWRADLTTSCGALSKSSQVTMARKLSSTGRFRVRADFIHGARDIANVSTAGSWLYYEVTK
jgi:hypothetical protein